MKKTILLLACILMTINFYAQLSPLSIGTIHPRDSIVIKYNATINNPLIPPSTTQISNQGTIAGSNVSSVLTDDPDSGPGDDATITLLSLFPLPSTLLEFKVTQTGRQVDINWKVTDEYNVNKYEVEKSGNALRFSKIGEVVATNSSGITDDHFSEIIPQQFSNSYFYRLKIIDWDGRFKQGPVARVNFTGDNKVLITVYPNPVVSKTATLSFSNVPAGKYAVQLYNGAGSLVYTGTIQHTGNASSQTVYLPEALNKDMYHLRITGGATRFCHSLIID